MSHESRLSRSRSPLLLGGGLVAVGVVIGAWFSGNAGAPPAYGAVAQDRSDCLPAIALERNELVLLRDQSGIYFIVDGGGNVSPLRVADVELRDLPGKSLLRAP